MKTKATEASVSDYIANLGNPQRESDCEMLVQMMEDASGHKAKMWGPSIIGFGKHRYRLANGKIEEICAIGFSPRGKAISIYASAEFDGGENLVANLGKHRRGSGGCIYLNKLEDIDLDTLSTLIAKSFQFKVSMSEPEER